MAGRSAVMAVSNASARRQASTALASLLGTHTAATLGSGGQPTAAAAAAAANASAVAAAAVAANDSGVSLLPEQLASRLFGLCAPVASSCFSSTSTASCLSSNDALRSSSGGCSSAGSVASSGRTAGQQWGSSASAHTQTQMRRGMHGLARAGGGSVGTSNVLTRPVSPKSTSASPASRLVPVRLLNVHEYQGGALMAKYGVNVPKGEVASTPAEAAKAAKELASLSDDGKVVVKAQVLAGGRGLGTFKNGFKGGVHIVPADEIEAIAGKMLGQVLVTKQTGEEGKPVNKVLVAERLTVVNEMYFAILLDRASAGPVMIACQYGGTSIEDLAEKYPNLIIKVPVNAREGITQAQADKVVEGLAPKVADKAAAAEQIKRMYDMFWTCDCTLLEVNPLVETASNEMVAADAKINFDDNAAFRQKEIFALRDHSQEDPREVAAAAADLNYIGLSGEIGCMVNGAGLAMATMDIIKLHGSSPANFLDVGGSASEQQVVEAFKILTSDSKVKAILVNIFGGIMKCDVIASGIVNAAKTVSLTVPLVVRLEGTNVETGKKILTESGLPIITAEDLDDAAIKAVKAVQG